MKWAKYNITFQNQVNKDLATGPDNSQVERLVYHLAEHP